MSEPSPASAPDASPSGGSTHVPRLTLALRSLLHRQRVAALGTTDATGAPFVSMVPFAMEPALGVLVLHVSALAAHTANLSERPDVSVLVMQAETAGEPVHALPRVTLDGLARFLEPDAAPESEAADALREPLPVSDWQLCRTAYLLRFPEAEPMTALGDFRFVAIQLRGARQVAGFGAARSVALDDLLQALEAPPASA